MKDSTKLALALAGLGAVAFVLYRSGKALPQALSSLGNSINPTNPNNVFASGVNAIGAAATGDPAWSLGGTAYRIFGSGDDKVAAMLRGGGSPPSASAKYARPPVTSSGGGVSDSGDPYNDGTAYAQFQTENYSNEGRVYALPIEPGLTAAEAMGFAI